MDYTGILIDIRKIIRSIDMESKRIEKAYGISIPQLLLLNHLNVAEDMRASQKVLTQSLNLNPSTVSGIVERLELKGLVARLASHKDKRISYIALTAKGADMLKSTPELLQEKLSKRLSGLPEAEIIKIHESLQKLIHLLEIQDDDAAPMLTRENPI